MSTRISYEHYFCYKKWQHIWNSYFVKQLLLLGLNIWVFMICSFTKSIFSLPGFFSQSTIFISKCKGDNFSTCKKLWSKYTWYIIQLWLVFSGKLFAPQLLTKCFSPKLMSVFLKTITAWLFLFSIKFKLFFKFMAWLALH